MVRSNEGGGDGKPEDPNAALSKEQREYLAGLVEKDGATDRAYRSKLRRRIVESVLDFQLLAYQLEEEELRTAFQEGYTSRDGPISYLPPNDVSGAVGPHPDYDRQGYPREGDLGSGFDGKSKFEATLEHVVRENPDVSKSSPELQRALTDAVVFLSRAAEAGQLDVRDMVEQGLEKYHRTQKGEEKVVTVSSDYPQTLRSKARRKVRRDERTLTRAEIRALEWADMTPEDLKL